MTNVSPTDVIRFFDSIDNARMQDFIDVEAAVFSHLFRCWERYNILFSWFQDFCSSVNFTEMDGFIMTFTFGGSCWYIEGKWGIQASSTKSLKMIAVFTDELNHACME